MGRPSRRKEARQVLTKYLESGENKKKNLLSIIKTDVKPEKVKEAVQSWSNK